jgi:hypothetical protein
MRPFSKNNQSKMDWKCGSSGTGPALHKSLSSNSSSTKKINTVLFEAMDLLVSYMSKLASVYQNIKPNQSFCSNNLPDIEYLIISFILALVTNHPLNNVFVLQIPR